jgi:hypothetical protein
MTCMRCGGFVVIDQYAWPGNEIDSPEVPQTHCVNCGWIEDPVIRENRKLMAMATLSRLNVSRVMRGPMECSDPPPRLVGSGRCSP